MVNTYVIKRGSTPVYFSEWVFRGDKPPIKRWNSLLTKAMCFYADSEDGEKLAGLGRMASRLGGALEIKEKQDKR